MRRLRLIGYTLTRDNDTVHQSYDGDEAIYTNNSPITLHMKWWQQASKLPMKGVL